MADTNAEDNGYSSLHSGMAAAKEEEEQFSSSSVAGSSSSNDNPPENTSDEPVQQCPKCDFSTPVAEHFNLHILSHVMMAKNLACLMMSLQSNSIKTEEGTSSTPLANFPLKNESEDILDNHDDNPESGGPFYCPECSHACSSLVEFRIHTLMHTSGKTSTDTEVPAASLITPKLEENESLMWQNSANKDLCCPICRCYSSDEASFNSHLTTHVHHGRFWCDKCLFSSTKIEEMKIHLSSHCTRSHKRISCPHCDFTTANKSYFKVHLSTHTGEGKMHCSYCSYSTVYKSNFKQHVAAHEKKSELQCPMCDFKCVAKSEYGLHFASHTGEKRLSCPYCKFNTSNKTYFKQHVGSHTGAGKMHCPFCKFSTVNKSYYRIHLAKHTGEGTLRCSMCSFTTVYKNNFRRHLAKHQTDAEESAVAMNMLPPRRGRPSKSWKEMQAIVKAANMNGSSDGMMQGFHQIVPKFQGLDSDGSSSHFPAADFNQSAFSYNQLPIGNQLGDFSAMHNSMNHQESPMNILHSQMALRNQMNDQNLPSNASNNGAFRNSVEDQNAVRHDSSVTSVLDNQPAVSGMVEAATFRQMLLSQDSALQRYATNLPTNSSGVEHQVKEEEEDEEVQVYAPHSILDKWSASDVASNSANN